jgi:hypothetical protein
VSGSGFVRRREVESAGVLGRLDGVNVGEVLVVLADRVIARLWAWVVVLFEPLWWRSAWRDRGSFRLGVEAAVQVRIGMRRTGLCQPCWMRESDPDIVVCEGRGCRNFEAFLDFLVR